MEYYDFKILDFSRECGRGAWLAIPNPKYTSERDIKDSVHGCDACVSDLDNTDAVAAESVAWIDLGKHLTNPKQWADLMFWGWCARTGLELARDGLRGSEMGKVDSWLDYRRRFLDSNEKREERAGWLAERGLERLVYKGVGDFYGLFPEMKKYYLTRNVGEIAWLFVDYFGFDGMISEVVDRSKETDEFIEELGRTKGLKRILMRGDFEVMPHIRGLNKYLRQGVIEDIVEVNVAKSVRHIDKRALINVSQDNQAGLVKFLNS